MRVLSLRIFATTLGAMLLLTASVASVASAADADAAERQRQSQELLGRLRTGLDAGRSGHPPASTATTAVPDLSRMRGLTRTQVASSLGQPTHCDHHPYCATSAAWVYDSFPSTITGGAASRLLILFDADGHCASAQWVTP